MKGRNGYNKKGRGERGVLPKFLVQMFLSRTGTVHEPEGEDLVWRRFFSAFQLSSAVVYNLIGRHQWECKLEWVRLWNVPQPIRRLNLRLTANQVMALEVPERPLNSTQRTFLRRS